MREWQQQRREFPIVRTLDDPQHLKDPAGEQQVIVRTPLAQEAIISDQHREPLGGDGVRKIASAAIPEADSCEEQRPRIVERVISGQTAGVILEVLGHEPSHLAKSDRDVARDVALGIARQKQKPIHKSLTGRVRPVAPGRVAVTRCNP